PCSWLSYPTGRNRPRGLAPETGRSAGGHACGAVLGVTRRPPSPPDAAPTSGRPGAMPPSASSGTSRRAPAGRSRLASAGWRRRSGPWTLVRLLGQQALLYVSPIQLAKKGREVGESLGVRADLADQRRKVGVQVTDLEVDCARHAPGKLPNE